MLNEIGLILILIGWLTQGYKAFVKKTKILSLDFVVLYAVGVALIAIEGFTSGVMFDAILNICIAIVALAGGIAAFINVK